MFFTKSFKSIEFFIFNKFSLNEVIKSFGKKLAKRLKCNFVDVDNLIERKEKKSWMQKENKKIYSNSLKQTNKQLKRQKVRNNKQCL